MNTHNFNDVIKTIFQKSINYNQKKHKTRQKEKFAHLFMGIIDKNLIVQKVSKKYKHDFL
ncbi:MAG: hypothetical protein B6I26_00765 [Desulfobacteraceae bacterium 4572_130]|nr:MAG: hypothetical protein B6I26_00765 [Desulfobacteraceae bacterium 4572_130]